MKTILVYFAGFATPIVIFFAIQAWFLFEDWKSERRYKRAWDKFSAEFEMLTPCGLAFYQAEWADDPQRYAHICDDRSRYFNMRWEYGRTTDV